MADEDEASSPHTKRVFINRLDSYSSKCIAKFLSTCVVGASLEEDMEGEMEEEEEQKSKVKKGTFEIVGTVSSKAEEIKFSFATEEYRSLNRDELLLKLMECDIIIYNITENTDQIDEASWAISALHADVDNFNEPKMFILISTVMTWATSKPVDPDQLEIPFTEEDYRRRRPHLNFKDHISVEKLVVKMGKTNQSQFSTYVVASGLQYGMGENIFHFFFKTSWSGEVSEVPVFGAGDNIIPTIHVNDLASVIQNIVDLKPKTHYLVAVDDSKNTLEDIVKVISHVLGPGKVQNVPKEDAFLTKDLTQTDIDSLFVNLRMEAIVLKENMTVHWVSESGIVENIDNVVEEYRQTRGLLPIRICILGPPAVGKSTVAEKISKHYKLHHIKVKDAIAECIAHLETLNQLEDGENENDENSQEFLEGLKDNMDQNEGRLDDQFLTRIMRDKLNSTACRNQGFVLDGFPKTYDQAKELFNANEDEPEDVRSKVPPFNRKIIPEFWNKALWTAETSINLYKMMERGQCGELKELLMIQSTPPPSSVKHGGGSVMDWACMATIGTGSLVFINNVTAGSSRRNSEVYRNILSAHIQPNTSKRIGRCFALQQDNDPKRNAEATKQFFKAKKWNAEKSMEGKIPQKQTGSEDGCSTGLAENHQGRHPAFVNVYGSQTSMQSSNAKDLQLSTIDDDFISDYEHILSLNAMDAFLKTRVLNLPESAVEGTHYTHDQFPRRLASFRENNVEDETVLNYFDELEINLEHIEITSSDDLEYLVVMEKIINVVGTARNYGLTSEELQEEEQRTANERLKQLAVEKAEIERKGEEEAANRAARWEEWSKRMEEVQKVEQDLLEAQTAPLRCYLMKNVMPTLTQGLIECCKAKPHDPVDFLAEYLFRNNPQV